MTEPTNPPIGGKRESVTRRMIGIAALWIVVLLLAGGFALDRILTRTVVDNFDDQMEYSLNAMLLSAELGPFGITVNSVAPGFMPTSPDYVRQWESYGPDGQEALVNRIAMRRIGRPADIAHAVMFFASDYAEWVTGQTLRVSGGM